MSQTITIYNNSSLVYYLNEDSTTLYADSVYIYIQGIYRLK
jgi:hypothetical protein